MLICYYKTKWEVLKNIIEIAKEKRREGKNEKMVN